MEKLISYLEHRRVLNILLILLYSVLIIHLHDFFVNVSIRVMNSMSLPVYNDVVKVAAIVFATGFFLYALLAALKTLRNRGFKIAFLFASIFLLGLHASVMFEMNIEIIHVIEYTILAILSFPLSRRIGATLSVMLPIMIIDEVNQYVFLYPTYNKYFELNDIALDITGSGAFLIMMNILGSRIIQYSRFYSSVEFIVTIIFLIASLLGMQLCFFALHEANVCSNTIFTYSRIESPDSFWHIHFFSGAKYHILKPTEGTLYIVFLIVLFSTYDFFITRNNKS